MTIKLGIVMDPIEKINYKKDTSFSLLQAASKRGWQIFYMEQQDLFQLNGIAMGSMAILKILPSSENIYSLDAKHDISLNTLNVILMRKDPPFDKEYIYSTYILENAEKSGVLIVNKPSSLRDFNEKYFATMFPSCVAPYIISRDIEHLKSFAKTEKDVIFKPLDGMGGASIFRVKENDANTNVILETLTTHGSQTIMGQKFIPEIINGDKRILMLNGEPLPYCLARVPNKQDFRGNLAAGAKGIGQSLSKRDLFIAKEVGTVLKEKGIIFAGLDVIGDYLTEINITSPTCVKELDRIFDLNISDIILDKIEKKLV